MEGLKEQMIAYIAGDQRQPEKEYAQLRTDELKEIIQQLDGGWCGFLVWNKEGLEDEY